MSLKPREIDCFIYLIITNTMALLLYVNKIEGRRWIDEEVLFEFL
jgi:hypothetical protein